MGPDIEGVSLRTSLCHNFYQPLNGILYYVMSREKFKIFWTKHRVREIKVLIIMKFSGRNAVLGTFRTRFEFVAWVRQYLAVAWWLITPHDGNLQRIHPKDIWDFYCSIFLYEANDFNVSPLGLLAIAVVAVDLPSDEKICFCWWCLHTTHTHTHSPFSYMSRVRLRSRSG